MKKRLISLLILLGAVLMIAATTPIPDIVVTSPDGIWTDTRAYTDLSTALTAIGAKQRDVYIARSETIGNYTIPANVSLHFFGAGAISVNGGANVTLQTTNISAPNRQIFTGAGDFDFTAGTVLHSAWFASLKAATTYIETDQITLKVTKSETITTNTTIDAATTLLWDSPYQLTVANGVTLALPGTSQIVAPNFKIIAGNGNMTFGAGTEVKSGWFQDFRNAIAKVSGSSVLLKVTKPAPMYYNTIVPANCTIECLPSCVITTNGHTLTFAADSRLMPNGGQIFAAAPGEVIISSGVTKEVYLEWWGGGSGGTDGVADSNAMLCAYKAVRASGIPIRLLSQVYYLDEVDLETVGEYDYGLTIEGSGQATQWYLTPGNAESYATNFGTILRAVSGADYVLAIGPSFVSNAHSEGADVVAGSMGLTMKDLTIDGNPVNNSGYDGTDSNNDVTNNTCDGIRTVFSNYGVLQNVSFTNCRIGTYLRYTDRTRYDNCRWSRCKYGLNFGSATQYPATATSGANTGISFVDCHTVKNDYNLYIDANRADFGANFVGGYWSYATINDFYIVSGGTLNFTGVNFENPSTCSNATKDAYFKIGRVYTAGWLQLENLNFTGCKFTDNSLVADRPRIISIVDSTNTSYPSLKSMNFSGNTIRNAAAGAFCDATLKSQLDYGIVAGNQMTYTYAPTASTIWYQIQESGNEFYLSNVEAKSFRLYQPIYERASATQYQLTSIRNGIIVTSTGAAAQINLILPAAADSLGTSITFVDTAGYGIKVFPYSGQQIAGTAGVDDDVVLAAAVGNSMRLVCVSTAAPQWIVVPGIGAVTY